MTMMRQRIMAAGLLVFSLLLWPLMYFLVFVVPKMAKALNEMAPEEPLPGLTVIVIQISNACQRCGLLVLPLILAVTVASAVWFVICLTRKTEVPTTGST